jgi:hypothetical protein
MPEDGLSVMEATAFLAGEKHGDHPDCTCPVIAAYVSRIADWASDEQRQQLRAFLPRLIGSRSAEHTAPRAKYLTYQAVTVFLPMMYDELKQWRIACALRVLPVNAKPIRLTKALINARKSFAATGTAAIAIVHADAAVRATDYVADLTAAAGVGAVGDVAACHAATVATAVGNFVSVPAKQRLWRAALAVLDGALAIGPSGPTKLTPEMEQRLATYAEFVGK